MDEGTHARDILENKKISLRRGYVGVLNRSQKDIEEGRDIEYCLGKEKQFFESMPCYRNIADRMGTPYLIKSLNHQLYEHIRDSLPALRQELSQKLSGFRKTLKNFNAEYGRNSNEPISVQFHMIKLVQNFIDKLQIEIFGYSEKVRMEELSAGATINHELYTSIENTLKLPEFPNEEKLLTTVANLHGIRNFLSIPSLALETVMSHLLSEYIDPLNNLVDTIATVLQSEVEKSMKVMNSYPSLRSEVLYLIRNSIDESAFNTKESLEKHMQSEMYFVNTYHPDFAFPDLKKTEAFFPMKLWNKRHLPQPQPQAAANSQNLCDDLPFGTLDEIVDEKVKTTENLTTNVCANGNIRTLSQFIKQYMVIQQKHIGDIAIKYILFFLVKNVMDFVKSGLVPTVLECAKNSDSILRECENDFNHFIQIESTIKSLKEALVAIQNF